jgi:hypothetical protein
MYLLNNEMRPTQKKVAVEESSFIKHLITLFLETTPFEIIVFQAAWNIVTRQKEAF